MSTRPAKMKVVQGLLDMGFSDEDVRAAIAEHGFDTQACVEFLTNGRDMNEPEVEDFQHRKLKVHGPIWLYSNEEGDWVPGQIVSITKELVSVIFGENDFRWFEKESPNFRTTVEKPAPLHQYYEGHSREGTPQDVIMRDPPDQGFQDPGPDEIDYKVQFDEPVLGLELYSDEEGYNCIVGRCVSEISQSKVTPGSHIVQVNTDWLSGLVFEDIRDAVKSAARSPPLVVTFRIKKTLYARAHHSSSTNMNPSVSVQLPVNNSLPQKNNYPVFSPYPASPAVSPLNLMNTPDTRAQQPRPNPSRIADMSDPQLVDRGSEDDAKCARPPVAELPQQNDEETEVEDIPPPFTVEECSRLNPGDEFDHRDDVGRYVLASVIDKQGSNLKIHYTNWNSKWDTWCDYATESERFCPAGSISRRPNSRFRGLKINDYVDINPVRRHPGWKVGRIRRMDKHSGQVQIIYRYGDEEYLWWTHLNNKREVARFMTLAQNAHQEYQALINSEAIEQMKAKSSGNHAPKHSAIPPAPKRRLPPKPKRQPSLRHASNTMSTNGGRPAGNSHQTQQSVIQISTPSYPTTQHTYRFDMYGNGLPDDSAGGATPLRSVRCNHCGAVNDANTQTCLTCRRPLA